MQRHGDLARRLRGVPGTRALGVSSSEWREGVQEFGAFAMLRHALGVGPFSR